MHSFTFDTPRLNCLPLTDVDSDEFFKLVKEVSVGQQRSCFRNPSKILDRVRNSGYVAACAFLKDSRITTDCAPALIGCICGTPLDQHLVLDIILRDEYRRRGLGSEFLKGFMKTCRAENMVGNFRVQVEKNNLTTISFLDSFGFSVYPGGDFTVIAANTTMSFHTYRACFKEVCA